ncbi:MAG: aspartate/glutamate racemase family protein [Pseudomonadota bacterium]
MKLAGGSNICGVTVGVLCLDSKFPKPPGHIKNPSGLSFPVLYETVSGATVAKLLNNPPENFVDPFIEAAKRLEAEGVRAITGSCGFLARYQKQLARAVRVPVFVSSLIQIPLVWNMIGQRGKVGVLTANKSSLTKGHFTAVGASGVPVVIQGMEDYREFREVILEGVRSDMDIGKIETEILASAKLLAKTNSDMGALVLECTDMPPYAYKIQQKLKVPVFDLTTLAGMVHEVVSRSKYHGLEPW